MPWPLGKPSPFKGTGQRRSATCPCGTVFERRVVRNKIGEYCSLECSWIYSTRRGRKPGCESWRKGTKGLYAAPNKGIPCSEAQKEQLRILYTGRAITPYGRGGQPSPTMLLYAEILCPLGYEMDVVHIPAPTSGTYMLDFAHREAKVNIEIDGNSHIGREVHDARRDAYLKNLGWKVIRIKA